MKSGPCLPQLEKARTQKRRPNIAKNKLIFFKKRNSIKLKIGFFSFLFFFLGCMASQVQHARSSLRCAGSFLAMQVLCYTAQASLQLWHVSFLSLVVARRLQGAWALQFAAWVSLIEVHELPSYGEQAQLPHTPSIWDLSSLTRDRTHVPCIGRWILQHRTTKEVPKIGFFKRLVR